MTEILRKYWYSKNSLGLYSRDDYPELTNYDISEDKIKCEEYTIQLWNDTTKQISY